jgi:SAM-dependent methyltransferase
MRAIDYSQASRSYDNTRQSDDTVIELMSRRGVFAKGRRVLDFGCGTGNYLAALVRLEACELFGLEPSEAMREIARAKCPACRIVKGDHASIPFDDGFFDFIYMTDVVHHVPDLDLLFESLHSKLAAGGLACVVTESREQIDARWYNAYFPSLAGSEKARYPDPAEIDRRAAMAGFRSAETEVKENPGPHVLDGAFLRMVGEKNYSMFRLLGEAEYESGYAAMRRDAGKNFLSPGAGETLLWFAKGGV